MRDRVVAVVEVYSHSLIPRRVPRLKEVHFKTIVQLSTYLRSLAVAPDR